MSEMRFPLNFKTAASKKEISHELQKAAAEKGGAKKVAIVENNQDS